MATLAEVARHLEMAPNNFKALVDKGVIEKRGRGKYDLEEARRQYILHIREVAAGRSSAGELDLSNERARLAKEQADAKEMENAVERGDLVYIEDVAKRFEDGLTKVRAKLLAIPSKVAPECHAAATVVEVQSLIDDSIREALNELGQADQE